MPQPPVTQFGYRRHSDQDRAAGNAARHPVVVVGGKSGKGELRIRFHSLEELDGVLERIGCNANS